MKRNAKVAPRVVYIVVTGTGSIFGVYGNRAAAYRVARKWAGSVYRSWIVEGRAS